MGLNKYSCFLWVKISVSITRAFKESHMLASVQVNVIVTISTTLSHLQTGTCSHYSYYDLLQSYNGPFSETFVKTQILPWRTAPVLGFSTFTAAHQSKCRLATKRYFKELAYIK